MPTSLCQTPTPPQFLKSRVRRSLFTRQELMGHASVETTQIYLHVMKKPGLGVRSPLDQ